MNRREFLKLSSVFALGFGLGDLISRPADLINQSDAPNILILVFDAWSSHHLPVHGYPRNTTPFMSRWLDRAIVYHNHTASGRFTVPGTASLLTGTLPWTHLAYDGGKPVIEAIEENNLFRAFPNHQRYAYSHNPHANRLIVQFLSDIERYTPLNQLYITRDPLVNEFFVNDIDIALVSWHRALKMNNDTGATYSLFFSRLLESKKNRLLENIRDDFPRGFPNYSNDNVFLLEESIDMILDAAAAERSPYVGYFHLFPPHDPYHTRRDFIDHFLMDGYQPRKKSLHPFGERKMVSRLEQYQREYDEYILYVDSEFNRLMENLSARGKLENTWVILTSDHGELFERGILGHVSSALYDPLIRVPLIIFPPDQTKRVDIYENTSAIDLLPTLVHLAGKPAPSLTEGYILPPFAPYEQKDIFSVDIKSLDDSGAMTKGAVALIRGEHKLIYFLGYEDLSSPEVVELYNLANDPLEVNDISTEHPSLAAKLLDEIKINLSNAARKYRERGER